jgi:serine/threonine-protein kinase
MYTLLTGRWLHDEGTLNEQLVAAMTKPCPKMSEAAPSVPAALGAIIDRAIAFDKQDRWPQAREMQDAIRTAYESVVGRPMSLAPHVRTSGRTSIVDNEMASLPTVAAPTSDEFARKSGGGPISVSASTSPTTASQKRKRVGGVAAGVVALVTIAVAGSIVLRNREGPKNGTVSSTTALASTVQAATAKDTTSVVEPAIATTETHVTTATTAKTAGLPMVRAKIDAGPAVSAAPSASTTEAVDIFGRRK